MKLEVKNLSKRFDRVLFENFTYTFDNVGFYGISGESGSGKSTLLNILSLIDDDYNGEIIYDGTNAKHLKKDKKSDFRIDNFGFIFQSFNLLEDDTVYGNLEIFLSTISNTSKDLKNEKIEYLLDKLGILKLKFEYVKNLSGGEKQRVAIARALINNPDIIFADEPTGALDSKNSFEVMEILKDLSKTKLVIMVSHDKNLMQLFVDKIIEFKDKNVIIYDNSLKEDSKTKPFTYFVKKNKKKKTLSIKSIFNRYKNLFKSKKLMQTFIISMFSISLFTFGLTTSLKDGLSSSIKESFSNITGENALILKGKDEEIGVKSFSSAQKSEVVNIYKEFDSVKRIGAHYLNDITNYFPDYEKLFIINKFDIKVEVEGFKANHFNNYVYKNNFKDILTYPNNIKLSKNEIVLGVDENLLKSLAEELGIKPIYKELGDYFDTYKTTAILELANNYWTYYDEILLDIAGIIPSNKIGIYSNNFFFNEYVFEDLLMFPSSLDIKKEENEPWVLKKIYYFESNEKTKIINELMYRSSYSSLIYDPNYILEEENKVFVFQVNKKSLDTAFFKQFLKENNIYEYYLNTESGYVNYGSLLNGFFRPTFFSKNDLNMQLMIDESKDVKFEDFYYLAPKENIARGNYLLQDGDSVRFSPKKNKEIYGRYPSNLKEIAISKKLASLIGLDKNDKCLYIGTFNKLVNVDNKIKGEFEIIKLYISGIVDDNKTLIYHDNDFMMTLFRDLFRFSAFNLNIESVTFLTDKKYESKEIANFNENNQDYEIIDPLEGLDDSINDTLYYILTILTFFSFLTTVASCVLLSLVNYIQFNESKRETSILIVVGVRKEEVIKSYFIKNVFNGLIALTLSLIMLFVTNFFISKVIQNMLGSFILINISLENVFYMVSILLIISLFSILIIYPKMRKIDFKKELHC